ncbi:hypothetical protein [Lapidilactobacillus bayanensis]|uniref:hypothetical protein n=1 Tax=Lapidilactobacillus bayanensis TaxID=2485998 RepID=UPI000F766BF7|nr:hypothetical protein [Lapidilactobacillus bayanensis]
MSQYPESIANLVGLAKEAEQQKNVAQAKKYFQRALELAQPFKLVQTYFDFLQRQQDFSEARQLLADFEQTFLTNGELIAYWQKLFAVQDYLVFDQSRQRLSRQHAQFSTAEEKVWTDLQQKLATVQVAPTKLAQLTANLLQAATTTTGQNVAVVLAQLQLLPPVAFVQAARPTLMSPTLNPEVRVKLINEISMLSADYALTLNWRGALRTINSSDLTAMQETPALAEFSAELAQYQVEQRQDEVAQQFSLSNLLTYILLTYPFCEEELQPHDIWRQFLITGQIPTGADAAEIAQLTYWQQQELKLLNNLNS